MPGRRYIFKANAIAAAARVHAIDSTRGLHHTIPALAVAALPTIGGKSEGKANNFCFQVKEPRKLSILSVQHAHSFIDGSLDSKGVAHTVTHSEVDGWSFLEKVRAERIVAHLESAHGQNESAPLIRPRKNIIEGLDLGGYQLKVVLDERLFGRCDSRKALADEFAKSDDLQTKYAWRFNADGKAKAIPTNAQGYYVCTLVKSIKWVGPANPDVTIDGYVLRWAGFGTIYIGEVLVGEGYRRISMIRVDLDAPPPPPKTGVKAMMLTADDGLDGGSGSGPDVGSNGGGT